MQSQWSTSTQAADDLDRLKLRVRRSSTVPVPKEAPLKLFEALRNPDVTTPELERIVGSDPALAAAVLGASEVAHGHSEAKHFTLHDAIIRLGTKALKGIALGTSFRIDPGPTTQDFDHARFTRHSISVAFVAKYFYAKKFRGGEICTSFSADEVYSIGLLHDIGYVLLANVAPDIYSRIAFMGRRGQFSIREGFMRLYQTELSELAPEFLSRWSHIQDLERALLAINAPWTFGEEYDSLCCVAAADYVVTERLPMPIEEWTVEMCLQPEIADTVTLAEEEFHLLKEATEAHCSRWLCD